MPPVHPDQQTPHTRRVPEHLVERDADELRTNHGQVEAVRRNEGGRVEEDVPAVRLGMFDQIERMFDA